MASDLETGTNNDIEKCYFKSELKRDDIVTAKKQKQKNPKNSEIAKLMKSKSICIEFHIWKIPKHYKLQVHAILLTFYIKLLS